MAVSLATAKSHRRVTTTPPPKAQPFTLAIVGLGSTFRCRYIHVNVALRFACRTLASPSVS